MIYVIKHKEKGFLTVRNQWSKTIDEIAIFHLLGMAKKICKIFKGAVVYEVEGITIGRSVWRSK